MHPERHDGGVFRGEISVVGLGLMGTAIAGRFLDHGWRTHVWNRTQAKAEQLIAAGGLWSDRPVTACRRVIVSLYSSDVVAEVLTPWLDDVASETIVIDTTTGDPDESCRWAEWITARGGRYLDAPISGSSEQTRRGEAAVMVGGSRTAFDQCRDVWSVLGRHCFHVGGPGDGARLKLVSNVVLGLNRAAVAEGLVLAEAIGLDLATTLEVLLQTAAASRQMELKGPKMIAGDFTPQARLSQHLKDVRLIEAAAAAAGIRLPLTGAHRELLELAERLGHGAHDNSAVFQTLRESRR